MTDPRFIAIAVERAERGLQLAHERGDVVGWARAIDALPDLQAAIEDLQGVAAQIGELRAGLTAAELDLVDRYLAGEIP